MSQTFLSNGPIDIRDDESEDPALAWYFDVDKGGYLLQNVWSLRKRYGDSNRSLSQGDFAYLNWCRHNVKKLNGTAFSAAFDAFAAGLASIVDDRFDDFIVPYGKHQGITIRQVRNKSWLKWVAKDKKRFFRDRVPIFYMAVESKLEHPRHYFALRDIGELLTNSAMIDEVDLWKDYSSDGDVDSDMDDFLVTDEEVGSGMSSDSYKSVEKEASDEGRESGESEASVAEHYPSDSDSPTPAGRFLKRKRSAVVLSSESDPEPRLSLSDSESETKKMKLCGNKAARKKLRIDSDSDSDQVAGGDILQKEALKTPTKSPRRTLISDYFKAGPHKSSGKQSTGTGKRATPKLDASPSRKRSTAGSV